MAAVRAYRPAPEHTHPSQVALPAALAALADPVRLRLVRDLAESADWERSCGSFDVPVGKAALSHHFATLRGAGLVEQRDIGPKRFNRLRRAEFEARFPGLLALVLRQEDAAGTAGPRDTAAEGAVPPAAPAAAQ